MIYRARGVVKSGLHKASHYSSLCFTLLPFRDPFVPIVFGKGSPPSENLVCDPGGRREERGGKGEIRGIDHLSLSP